MVDFPEPEGPQITIFSPFFTFKLMFYRVRDRLAFNDVSGSIELLREIQEEVKLRWEPRTFDGECNAENVFNNALDRYNMWEGKISYL